jgi:hypothetical protein
VRRVFLQLAGVGVGTTVGGLLVGTAEALYFRVDPLWAALFYGTLWAVIGIGGARARRRRYRSVGV